MIELLGNLAYLSSTADSTWQNSINVEFMKKTW